MFPLQKYSYSSYEKIKSQNEILTHSSMDMINIPTIDDIILDLEKVSRTTTFCEHFISVFGKILGLKIPTQKKSIYRQYAFIKKMFK